MKLHASVLVLALVLPATSAIAAPAGDRKAPTTPTNLRVTAVTAYTVSLAWNPSTDNSGVNTFSVAAVDSAGNRSLMSSEFSETFDGCVF